MPPNTKYWKKASTPNFRPPSKLFVAPRKSQAEKSREKSLYKIANDYKKKKALQTWVSKTYDPWSNKARYLGKKYKLAWKK